MKWRVLVTCPHLQRTLGRYDQVFADGDVEVVSPDLQQQLTEEELLGKIGEFDGAIAGDDPYTARVLERAGRLRIVSKWGIGLDAIDLEAAKRLGIKVTNTPGAFGDEVADVALGYLLMLARGLHRQDASVRAGGWEKVQGISLRGKSLGVVGVGSIGRSIVRRAVSFGLKALGHDREPVPERFRVETGLECVDLDQLLERSLFVVVCCNLTTENRGMVGARELALMPPGAFLINVARGALVDEEALIAALSAGRLGGAALDVFANEPLPEASPLRSFSEVILGTHNASNTLDAVLRVNDLAIRNLLDGLQSPRETPR